MTDELKRLIVNSQKHTSGFATTVETETAKLKRDYEALTTGLVDVSRIFDDALGTRRQHREKHQRLTTTISDLEVDLAGLRAKKESLDKGIVDAGQELHTNIDMQKALLTEVQEHTTKGSRLDSDIQLHQTDVQLKERALSDLKSGNAAEAEELSKSIVVETARRNQLTAKYPVVDFLVEAGVMELAEAEVLSIVAGAGSMLTPDEIKGKAKQTVAVKIKQAINRLEAAGILTIVDDAYDLSPEVRAYLASTS